VRLARIEVEADLAAAEAVEQAALRLRAAVLGRSRTSARRDVTPEDVERGPRWATVAAWLTVASVLPSAAWRVAVGLGVPLGWDQAQLDRQDIPGSGTGYVIGLSVASIAAAALTLGLVRPWGERVPAWVPVLRDRRIPAWPVVVLALAGAVAAGAVVVLSIANWPRVSGFDGRLTSGWALLMAACYAPAALWPVLLISVTVAYARRRLSPRS